MKYQKKEHMDKNPKKENASPSETHHPPTIANKKTITIKFILFFKICSSFPKQKL
jgi:hypothetical protein